MGFNDYYKGMVLRELYFSENLSCADLSDQIGKSIPFTLKTVNELIGDGYVRESGYAASSGGRRPIIYSLRPDTIYVLSVAMDQLVTRISVMDIHNRHATMVEKFELNLYKNPSALSILTEKMEEAIKKSGVERKKIIGAGIGMPGFIDVTKGVNYSFFENDETTVVKFISERLKLPVYIDNDSSLIALAEFRFGSARHLKNAMVVNVGCGVGLGMVLNGEIFRGHNGFAGEFSHIPMFNNNKLCGCGKSGCLETECSILVVIEKATAGLKSGRMTALSKNFPSGDLEQDWKEISMAAHKGDQFVIELLSYSGYNIGKGISILIHLINPESVIISGRGALAGKVWLAPIQQAINEHCIPRLAVNTTITVSTLSHQALLTGSAALVIENSVKETARIIHGLKSKSHIQGEIN